MKFSELFEAAKFKFVKRSYNADHDSVFTITDGTRTFTVTYPMRKEDSFTDFWNPTLSGDKCTDAEKKKILAVAFQAAEE